jgi:hypothetical protein
MEIIEKLNYPNFKEEQDKSQILLTHTSRPLMDIMVSIKYRFGGKPPKLPHYFIDRDGKVIQVLDNKKNGNFSSNDRVNTKSIVICLENLGWLEKKPLTNYHINWIGNIYKGNIVDKKWRDYFFWQPYTEIQVEKTAELCKKLSTEMDISLNCIGHNTKVKGCESFLGILTKSNFDEFATDLSPAFNFEQFKKLLENE